MNPDPLKAEESPQPVAESWRAEVASRVSSYRARRRRGISSEAPGFDFAAAESQRGAALAEARAQAPRRAFDTNYYRRKNAEALDPFPASELVAARVTEIEEFPEARQEAAPDPGPCESGAQAFDLVRHPVDAIDDFLAEYVISREACAESADAASDGYEDAAPAAGAGSNLIVFPRPLLEPMLAPVPSADELAEPMLQRPRILEVPEDIMPAMQGSLFPEIRLDAPEPELNSSVESQIEVPMPVAPISDRLLASLVDIGWIAVSGAIFAAIAMRAMPELPHSKPFWMILGAVNFLLWALYQHLFLLYAGRTPGMALRQIRLSSFAGGAPDWKQRGLRARFLFISLASVGLGFLWAMVDEDTLCWHDRLSRTFPTME